MKIDYKDVSVDTCDDVYEPSEDTFLLLDVLESLDFKMSDDVLEIGTGTGIVAIALSKRVRHVTAVDINPKAVLCAEKNLKMNDRRNMDIFLSDLFSKVDGKYDVIVFNPPYLPVGDGEESCEMIGRAWNGGRSGRMVTDKFLDCAPRYLKTHGMIVVLDSSKAKYEITVEKLKRCGFDVCIAGRVKLFFEELVVIMAKR